MVKVAFPFHVLHKGHLIAPNEALDVTEDEAEKLIGFGAKVVEMSHKILEKEQEPNSQAPAKSKDPIPQKKG